MKSQAALSKATQEATNGRLADVGLDLGALAGRDVTLRAGLNDVDKLVDTNALVGGRLDTAQQRVGELIDTAEAIQKDLLAARNSANGGNIIAQPASSNLDSLMATLNVTMDGQYLFGGINTGVQPMTDYTAGSTNQTAIDAAFLANFGFAQNSPSVSPINDLAGVGAALGTAQEQTTNATSRLKAQGDLITQQITAMEKVDPAEASVRVTNLQNQLEMSLALTARIQQMSILNYLPVA